jgi:hypothetical protein
LDKVKDYDEHCYTVTASYGVFESEFSNESCAKIPNAITEYNADFKIYPNPTTGELTVCGMRCEVGGIEIYDVYGRNVSSNHLINTSSNHLINISNLANGVYFLRIQTEQGVITKKVVKD